MGKRLWQGVRKNGIGFALSWVIICGYVRLTSGHWPSPADLLWGIAFSMLVIVALPSLLRAVAMRRQGQPNFGLTSPTGGTQMNVGKEDDLQTAVQKFIEAADRADIATIAATYDADFHCVRVADSGGFVNLNREQMMQFWDRASSAATSGNASGHAAVQTRETKVHHVETVGEIGYVLMTRIKDLGSGWEPLFYTWVWKKYEQGWRLQREFVHQKTVPQWR